MPMASASIAEDPNSFAWMLGIAMSKQPPASNATRRKQQRLNTKRNQNSAKAKFEPFSDIEWSKQNELGSFNCWRDGVGD